MKKVVQSAVMLLMAVLAIMQGYCLENRASQLAGTHADAPLTITLFTPGEFIQAGGGPVKNLEKLPGFTFKRTAIDLKDILHHQHLLYLIRLQEYPVFTGETLIRYRKTSRIFPFHAFW